MSGRTFHNKNRHGCITCKRRKKRCDLSKPVCGPCNRLAMRCSYAEFLYPASMSLCPSHALYEAFTQLPEDMRSRDSILVFHFLQLQPSVIGAVPGLTALRMLDFPVVAPQYPFLLHGVLSASASHISCTMDDPSKQKLETYANRARFHQQVALSSYIRSLRTINAQSCHFIFGFSLILAGLQLSFCSTTIRTEPYNLKSSDLFDRIGQIFDLMQGAVAVANAASQWIRGCRSEPRLLPIKTMLHANRASPSTDTGNAIQDLILGIKQRLQHHSATCEDGQRAKTESYICVSAVLELRNVFSCLNRPEPDNYKAVLGWFAFVEARFVELLKGQHPAALVVIAYFGIALHALDHAWWLQGLGAHLVNSVAHVLQNAQAHTWFPLMEWPMFKVSQEDFELSGRATANLSQLLQVSPTLSVESPFDTALECTYAGPFRNDKP